MKHPSIVPAAVAAAFTLAVACGPKLDAVQVDTDAPTDGATTDPSGATAGSGTTGTTGVCGTTAATIGYAAHARAQISKSCATSSCHGGAQPPNMTDYATSKSGFSDGGLERVQGGTMPPGGGLSANEKCILTTWASGAYAP